MIEIYVENGWKYIELTFTDGDMICLSIKNEVLETLKCIMQTRPNYLRKRIPIWEAKYGKEISEVKCKVKLDC